MEPLCDPHCAGQVFDALTEGSEPRVFLTQWKSNIVDNDTSEAVVKLFGIPGTTSHVYEKIEPVLSLPIFAR